MSSGRRATSHISPVDAGDPCSQAWNSSPPSSAHDSLNYSLDWRHESLEVECRSLQVLCFEDGEWGHEGSRVLDLRSQDLGSRNCPYYLDWEGHRVVVSPSRVDPYEEMRCRWLYRWREARGVVGDRMLLGLRLETSVFEEHL